MGAEDAVAYGVKGAAPEAKSAIGEEGFHPLQHLPGGFVGESEEEDLGRGDAMLQQVGHAVGERARLAAARARDDEGGAGRGLDGFEFVEFTSTDPAAMKALIEQMGFTAWDRHPSKDLVRYRQGRINLLVNQEPEGQAAEFRTVTYIEPQVWLSKAA